MKYHWRLKILILIIIFSTCNIYRGRTYAQEIQQRSFTISPPIVEKELNPGDISEGIIKIENQNNDNLILSISTQDYIVEDTNGTPALVSSDKIISKYSAKSWIGTDQSTVTIEPHKKIEISYYIKIPKDSRPGGHYAAIIFSPINRINNEGTGATVNTLLASLFYLNIKGNIIENALLNKIKINSFQEYGPINIATQIRNLGDLHIRPDAKFTLYDTFGKVIETQQLKKSNIFPGSSLDFKNTMGKKWMIGQYRVEFLGGYGKYNNKPLSSSITFIIFPWKISIIIILITTLFILGTIYFVRERGSKRGRNPLIIL